jgi:hypothetical protein
MDTFLEAYGIHDPEAIDHFQNFNPDYVNEWSGNQLSVTFMVAANQNSSIVIDLGTEYEADFFGIFRTEKVLIEYGFIISSDLMSLFLFL